MLSSVLILLPLKKLLSPTLDKVANPGRGKVVGVF